MEESATRKEMPKDLNSKTPMNISSGQELSSSEIAEGFENNRLRDDLKQGTSLECSIQSPELLTAAKSSDMTAADEVDNLECSNKDDCANVEGNFPVKDFPSKYSEEEIVHTTEKSKEEEFEDCDIESSLEIDLQVIEPKNHSIDSFIEASESSQLNVDINVLSTDNVHRRKDTDSHQELSMEELVRRTTTDQDHEIKYLASSSSRHRFGETVQLSQQNKLMRNLLKIVPDQEVHLENTKTSTDSAEKGDQKLEISDELKATEVKRILKDIYLLSSCIEEIARMNENFKNAVVKMLSDIMQIRRSTKYLQECLLILRSLPTCTILIEETDRHPPARVNVYDFGADLLHEHSLLFKSFRELLMELNEYRLKFVDLSENFSLIPFEFHVSESKSKVLDMTFEAAVKVYEDYFENDGYEILHDEYVIEYEELRRVGLEFDTYLKRLGLCCYVN